MMLKDGLRHNVISEKKYIILLLFFLVIGFILRINNLSSRSLWTDEFFTFFQSTGHGVDIKELLSHLSHKQTPDLLKASELKIFLKMEADKSIKDVSAGLLNTDTHPPLYFWIIYLWMRLFGDSVFAVRFFSIITGILSILLAYQVTRHLFNRDAAIFSALFVSISSFCVRYSQEARAYSLIMALGLLSWLFILKFEKHKRNLYALCFAVFNCMGIYVHYFYIFISLAQFLYFTFGHRQDSRMLKRFYLFFLYSWLFFSPWFTTVIFKGYNFYLAEWIFGYPGLINKIYCLLIGITRYVLIFDTSKIAWKFILLIGLFLFIYMALRAWKDMINRYPMQFLFCLTMSLAPLLCMFFIDIVQHGALLKQERFWMFPFFGFIPLAGYFFHYNFQKGKFVLYPFILLMLLSCVTVVKFQFGPAPAYASVWINRESYGEPSAVIVYNMRSVVFAQSYYLDGDIYLIPVSDQVQFENAVKSVSELVDRIFIARHYHRSDVSLMDQSFMQTTKISSGFNFKTTINIDNISVSEYVK